MGRQHKVTKAIKDKRYNLKINNEGNQIHKMQNELSSKLSEIKSGMASL